ncbi:MAG TPA: dCMP deaminase family protein [Hadesarchaea archaeon]|nr:dCMP deaminase family protein [Hadesarchaea archaeon]
MSKYVRPNKDEYYLEIAKSVCLRSSCIRRQFGAIVVREDAVVATGYNGPARGVVNCMEVGCLKDELRLPHYSGYDYCPGIHSEENCIINAARHGTSVLGGVLYLYGQDFGDGSPIEGKPCDRCKRAIINAGIKEVVTKKSDSTIIKTKVSEWVKEDTKNYLSKLKQSRGGKKMDNVLGLPANEKLIIFKNGAKNGR